jgi:hypothetical protein
LSSGQILLFWDTSRSRPPVHLGLRSGCVSACF